MLGRVYQCSRDLTADYILVWIGWVYTVNQRVR